MEEALVILQEECAEVIQEASKCLRFGIDDVYDGKSNRNKLERELGDLLAMIDVLHKLDVVSYTNMEQHASNKLEKLRKWSNINL